jgi:hypothetical protein
MTEGEPPRSGRKEAVEQEGYPDRVEDPAGIDRAGPYLLPTSDEFDPAAELNIAAAELPFPNATLGDVGIALRVEGPERFPASILVHPIELEQLAGTDTSTMRMFRDDEERGLLRPVWNSGLNLELGFLWAKIDRPGVYLPLGLPRDRLLQELIRTAAERQRLLDSDDPRELQEAIRGIMAPFLEADPEDLNAARELLAVTEVQSGFGDLGPHELRFRQGRHLAPFPLPRDATLDEFRKRLLQLEPRPGGLPEAELLYPPDSPAGRTSRGRGP